MPAEDFQSARRITEEVPRWKEWRAQREAETQEWMARMTDRVEWTAGWGHQFVSPKDGSPLEWTPEVPDTPGVVFRSRSDPDVAVSPEIFRAWVLHFRIRHILQVEQAALLFRLTGDDRYAAWSMAQLDFYADNFSRFPERTVHYGPSRIAEQPLDEAVMVIHLAEAARLLRSAAPAPRFERWREGFFEPECVLLNRSMQRVHNIACWLRSATGCVALLIGDDTLFHASLDGEWGLRRQLREGVTSDYFWYEQSFGYNEYVAQALLPFLVAAARAGRGPEIVTEMAITANLLLAPNLVRAPEGELPAIADITRIRRAPLAATLAEAHGLFPTSVGAEERNRSLNWQALLDPNVPSPKEQPLPPVRSQNYDTSRFAVLSEHDWHVFFHYGQLSASHAQAEALSFSAYWRGVAITRDVGTVGYGSPLHKGYFARGLAHNALLVDGHGQTPPGHGSNVSFNRESGRVAAEQPTYRQNVTARRELRITRERLEDVCTVETQSDVPHALGLSLHLQGEVSAAPPGMAPAHDLSTGRPDEFSRWREVQATDGSNSLRLEVVTAGTRFRVTIAVPGAFRAWIGRAPDRPPLSHVGIYLETMGRTATFTTTFEPIPSS